MWCCWFLYSATHLCVGIWMPSLSPRLSLMTSLTIAEGGFYCLYDLRQDDEGSTGSPMDIRTESTDGRWRLDRPAFLTYTGMQTRMQLIAKAREATGLHHSTSSSF